jgi:hypothetical protein
MSEEMWVLVEWLLFEATNLKIADCIEAYKSSVMSCDHFLERKQP